MVLPGPDDEDYDKGYLSLLLCALLQVAPGNWEAAQAELAKDLGAPVHETWCAGRAAALCSRRLAASPCDDD